MANENEPPTLPIKSPLALLGVFLYVIRHRFTKENNLPWIWHPDNAATGVVIEAQYNPNTETEDTRPGIYIDQSNTIYTKVSTGNLDQVQPNYRERGLEHYYSLANTDVSIDCVSPLRAESLQLADAVQTYLESSKYILMRTFGLRDFSPIIMGPTQPTERQTYLHQTTVSFRVEYERRWATIPVSPVLNGLEIHFQDKSAEAVSEILSLFF